ncbi:MAG: hypothetical protein HN778_05395 [Prolixibacteraceae bacterium]|nr:hypothetical protein [Prolixibacteraceae bacterium]MBT6763981.1 hypothetical protein [Prolixibacteraceae bacterium]MBT6996968.1 hypothetical protein [Prolixibacteraceae bacterium]MBT7394252.1 hypothetical protein [Prolixibacteraceae bacterium]
MKNANHIIDKVFLEVNTSELETAHFIKNNISQFLKDELFPRLEVLFEEYNLPEDILRFNELSINLSIENGKDLKAIKYEIEKQIDLQIKQSIKNIKSSNEIERLAFEKDKTVDQTISTEENLNSIFLFFLENGHLPWYANITEFQKYLSSESLKKSLQKAAFLAKINACFSKEENLISRFVFQLTDEVLIIFLIENLPKMEDFKTSVLNLSKGLRSSERNLFWKSLIMISIKEKEKQTADLFLDFFYQIEIDRVTFNEQTGFSNLKEFVGFYHKIIPKKLLVESGLKRRMNNLLVKRESGEVLDVLSQVKVESDFETGEIIIEDELFPINNDSDFLVKTLFEIAVQNAGLILLHPFFKTFFIKTGIADKTGLLHNNKLEIATQVLHFIATGEDDYFEGNMVLEKFLIGLPLKMPIPNQSLLNDVIRNEVMVLLENVIKNWPALKNTSPAGLRQMFIHRDGKLIQKEKGFKLIVERKAQDVLLEKLNWNISIVKLPWNKEMLFVEW